MLLFFSVSAKGKIQQCGACPCRCPLPASALPSSRTRRIVWRHAEPHSSCGVGHEVVEPQRIFMGGAGFLQFISFTCLKLFYGCSCQFSMSLFKHVDCSLRQTWISRLVCHLCNTGRHHNVFIYLNVPFSQVCIKCKLTNVVLKMFKV